jgi:hypothetical protein
MFLFMLVMIGALDLACITDPTLPPNAWTLSSDNCIG